MDDLPGRWHSHWMQGRHFFRRLVLTILLSQALALHGLAGVWGKTLALAGPHEAGAYLCALSGPNATPEQPLPADRGSSPHYDCLFMCAAAGSGPAIPPAELSLDPARIASAVSVLGYLMEIARTPEAGAMPARGPPGLV